MAQTNYSPIQLYYSTTASAAPTAGNLASGELAINITDGILFYKDNAGAVQTLATKSGTSGSFTTLSASSTVTFSGGTANGVAYLNGSKVLTTGSALTFDGTSVLGLSVGTPVFRLTPSTTNALQGIEFGTAGNLDAYIKSQPNTAEFRINSGRSPAWGGFTSFYIDTSEQMRLTSTGLGIGTSSPSYKLDVSGTAANTISGVRDTTGYALFRAANAGAVAFYGIDTSGGAVTGTANATMVWGNSNVPLIFGTNNTKQATLDTSGNLGLGVTPSAWDTVTVMQAKRASFAGYSSNAYLGANWYYASGDKYIASDYATQYQQSLGKHMWFTAPSGTAGNAITFTQAMTLDASGNLTIGATVTGAFQNVNSFYYLASNAYAGVSHVSGTASGSAYLNFSYNAGVIGSITQNGTTGVLYNLTSDYRLKNNQQPLTGAKDFVMALQPKKWQWWDGSGEGVGFIAHEFMEVAKHSGNGEKDAVDENGNPVYQSIQPSSSEVMANLVALVQELVTENQTLKARLDAIAP